MTDSKEKAGMKPEEGIEIRDKKQDISGPEIIVSGISGTKTLRVGRVNKKARPPKDEPTPEVQPAIEVPEAPGIVASKKEETPIIEAVSHEPEIPVKVEESPVKEPLEEQTVQQVQPVQPDTDNSGTTAVPSQRPETPSQAPSQRPPMPGSSPSQRSNAPGYQPTQRPPSPGYGPSQRPNAPGNSPSQRPAQGQAPGYSPSQRPAQGQAPGARPQQNPGVVSTSRSTFIRPSDRDGAYNSGTSSGPSYGPGRPRPAGGYPPTGGYPPRRQPGPMGKDDVNEQSGRGPSAHRGPPKSDKPDLPPEMTKDKANFAARDAFEKSRKDPSKDTKKDPGKPVAAQTSRKSDNMRMVNSAISGMQANEILSDDSTLEALYSNKPKGRRGAPRKRGLPVAQQQPKAVLTHVQLPESITIKDFAEGIQKRSAEIIKKLMKLGLLATINQEIDFDTATLIAEEFGITTELLVEVTEEDILFDDTEDTDENLQPRPPVVVVMGHVDHGKTSLLDKIRSSSVVKGEAGGITQHIGAYTVKLKNRMITFLDTPGHEAFTTMRARGAQVTDIAILVVAADDGVMPQTVEAINHAKAANTEIVVAINKMDRPGANPDKVKQELSTHGVIPEEWGGSTVVVPVSAHTGEGIDELLEMVLLTADVMDLKADPNKQAKGTVIEAKLDKNRGPVATVLVQRGTLHNGDAIVTGSIVGRIRAMTDDKGGAVKKAGPSMPVEILGLSEVPEAGELFYSVTDEKVARQLVDKRRTKQREDQLHKSSRMTLETLSETLAAGEVLDLNLIIKADVQGSVEAVTQSLEKLTSDEVHVKVIHGGVGAITESDILLADVSNAVIIGFNVRPGVGIAEKAKEVGVDIKLYRVIYNAIEDVQAAMKGMLKPKFEEVILGHIEIRQIFKVSNVGTIGGAYVTDGKVLRSSEVRIVRDGIVVHEGKLASLKRFKDDVKEVMTGYECGISIENYNDIKEGDVIEAFEMREIVRK
ncbi:MAG: translation initiation factor IF-2 [Oscillospiraceae bacterium]|nr:translation initiation factor IF-2 [Oscillospiraceae bacterium]